MGKNRDYVVCTSCGDASWQFAYRAWKKPQCKFCGSKWSEWTSKGYRLSDYMTVDNNNWQLWQQGGKKNTSPKAQAVLTEVWEFLPQQAKDMIGEAGWNPPQPTVPPGLEGWSSSPDRSAESQELVRSLWESAEEDQKKVLEMHAPDLPKEIQDLLEEPPRPKPTARQAVEAANKQFKEATAKLREAIVQKSDLQSKVDKVKEQYTGLLRQLQEANEAIRKMQQLVQSKQTALQEAVKDDLVEAEDEMAAALKKAGLVATKEQAQVLAQALQEKGRTQPMDVDSLESEVAGMDVSALQSLKRKIDEIYGRKEQEARTATTGAVGPRDSQPRRSRTKAWGPASVRVQWLAPVTGHRQRPTNTHLAVLAMLLQVGLPNLVLPQHLRRSLQTAGLPQQEDQVTSRATISVR